MLNGQQKTNGFITLMRLKMTEDYALPLIVIRRLSQEYEAAMQKKQWALAYQTAEKMVEMALKLQDVADD